MEHPEFNVTLRSIKISGVTMANTTRPLTDTEVKQAKTKKKEYSLSDGKGLLLRIKPADSKLWLFNYTRLHTKNGLI